MKNTLLIFLSFIIFSCSSIRVYHDFDTSVDFDSYTTYAFFKPGIDEVEISDLDKKRILKAIETELVNKSLSPSDTPELLVNIAVKSSNDVYINNWNGLGYGWGWGYGLGMATE